MTTLWSLEQYLDCVSLFFKNLLVMTSCSKSEKLDAMTRVTTSNNEFVTLFMLKQAKALWRTVLIMAALTCSGWRLLDGRKFSVGLTKTQFCNFRQGTTTNKQGRTDSIRQKNSEGPNRSSKRAYSTHGDIVAKFSRSCIEASKYLAVPYSTLQLGLTTFILAL